MKNLFSKLFFVSDCAKGMLFALMLVTVGNYLWVSFCYLAALRTGAVDVFISGAVGVIPITLYALAQAVAAVINLVKILRSGRDFRPLWHLIPAGVCFALGAVGVVRVFPPLYVIGAVGSGDWSGRGWVSGGLPGLPPEYWSAVFLLALVLILVGGLMLTEVFVAAEKKKFRSAFGPATLTLWAVLVLGHLVTLRLAQRESRELAAVCRELEQSSGRPLSAAGLEAMYHESGKSDAEFWKRHAELVAALPKIGIDGRKVELQSIILPDRPAAETLAWYGKLCDENRSAIENWERCFDRVPPLPPKHFVSGDLKQVRFPELRPLRPLVSGLEYSCMRLALTAGNVDAAWSCYRRIRNVGILLKAEPFLIGGMMVTGVEGQRLECIEKLLESRLLADTKLDELDADLAALENELPRLHRRTMFSEAAYMRDILANVEESRIEKPDLGGEVPNGGRPGSFAQFRRLFPQCWYHVALDKKTLFRSFLRPDLGFVFSDCDPRLLHLSTSFITMNNRCHLIFDALIARTRGMRVLIRAEKHRRKHGEFPKTLADLPLDPFTDKPLVYELGKAEIAELVWETPVSAAEKTVKVSAEVVQVHSTLPKPARQFLKRSWSGVDLTRAMIRIR